MSEPREITKFKELIERLPQNSVCGLLTYSLPQVSSYADILPRRTKEFADMEGQLKGLKRLCKAPDTDKRYSDRDFRERKLAEITYFRLKGYAVTLKKVRKNNISFESVCRVYDCDTQLRELLLRVLQRIEIYFRAQLSNFHANPALHRPYDLGELDSYQPYAYLDSYRPYAYLDMKTYDYRHNHSEFLRHLAETVEQNSANPFVEHYLKNHSGIMPLWVVSELMSFGDLVYFYKNWSETPRTTFLSEVLYKNHPGKLDSATHGERFVSWLDACRKLRNVCSHCGQLYGRFFPWTPNLPPKIPKPAGSSLPLWASILAAEFLYPDETEWKAYVTPRLKMILYSAKADYYLLRRGLGFPPDWDSQLNIWWNM